MEYTILNKNKCSLDSKHFFQEKASNDWNQNFSLVCVQHGTYVKKSLAGKNSRAILSKFLSNASQIFSNFPAKSLVYIEKFFDYTFVINLIKFRLTN